MTNEITTSSISCSIFRQRQTNGILLTTFPINITYKNVSLPEADKNWFTPSVIVYSSDDGLPTPVGFASRNHYVQYSTTRSDAYGIKENAVDYMYETYHMPEWESWERWLELNKAGTTCTVTAVRYDNYVLVRMENCGIVISATTTLPDEFKDKDIYMAITGEQCTMSDFTTSREPDPIEDGTITPVKFRKSNLPNTVGDIPNIDCMGWWTAHSDGVIVGETPVEITYNTISYQQAVENWHTPLVVVFSALDQSVGGIAYNEFSVVRSDGFGWNIGADSFSFESEFSDEWTDWGPWLSANKSGVMDCKLTAVRTDNAIILTNTNSGVTVKSVIQIPLSHTLPVCVSLSGELCSISNIRIKE